ncbi:MAG: diguanylate cyclase [Pseudomonadota bacterium]
MPKILLVEDNLLVAKLLARRLENLPDFQVIPARTMKQAEELLLDHGAETFFLALLDLILPDAPNGEIVDLTAPLVPVVVITNKLDTDIQEYLETKNIIDYVIKRGPTSMDYVVELVERLYKNQFIKIMVVDDSSTSRALIRGILQSHRFQVIEAENGRRAIELLEANPEVRLVITDYIMPEMDGFDLLKWIREDHGRPRTELAVIGLSGHVANAFSAMFIKHGGNDFMTKPFLKEEFICRVVQNIEYLEHVKTIREMADRDFLTGIYNRRSLFDLGRKFFSNAKRENFTLTVGMIDIDFFKTVNDRFGHDAGDQVLKKISELMVSFFRESDVIARVGGEEFCVLAPNMDKYSVFSLFDKFRELVETTMVRYKGVDIKVTISMGVTSTLGESLDEMIRHADALLYQAKAGGRNRVAVE